MVVRLAQPLDRTGFGGVVVLHHGRIVAEGPVSQLRAMTQRNASLEDVIAQLVTTVDPARTASEIADVSGLSA